MELNVSPLHDICNCQDTSAPRVDSIVLSPAQFHWIGLVVASFSQCCSWTGRTAGCLFSWPCSLNHPLQWISDSLYLECSAHFFPTLILPISNSIFPLMFFSDKSSWLCLCSKPHMWHSYALYMTTDVDGSHFPRWSHCVTRSLPTLAPIQPLTMTGMQIEQRTYKWIVFERRRSSDVMKMTHNFICFFPCSFLQAGNCFEWGNECRQVLMEIALCAPDVQINVSHHTRTHTHTQILKRMLRSRHDKNLKFDEHEFPAGPSQGCTWNISPILCNRNLEYMITHCFMSNYLISPRILCTCQPPAYHSDPILCLMWSQTALLKVKVYCVFV